MGLSTKQVSGDDQGFELPAGKTTLQSGAPELPKPPSARRQHQSEPLKCPRCGSSNTKFCYYNNYNTSQPRHFCRSCKRHWTKGGTLRNVPIGGGRKNKRPKTSKSAAATQDRPSFPLSANTGTYRKSLYNNNFLYQALIGSPLLHEKSDDCINISTNDAINSTGFNVSSSPEDPNTEFQFSSFDMSWNPISYQSLNTFDHYPGDLDSIEESTTTNVNNVPSSGSVTWPGPNTDSSLNLPTYWDWDEIDVLTSSGPHLDLSWDDYDDGAEIKPSN